MDSGLSALGASGEWLVTRPAYLVTEAGALEGYRLRLTFEDHTQGMVDLSDLIGRGGVFSALKDI
jgi:uncharacterized protein DUF2442